MNYKILAKSFIDSCVDDYLQNDALIDQYSSPFEYLAAMVQNAIDDQSMDRVSLFDAYQDYIVSVTTDNAHCAWVNEPELHDDFESEQAFIDFSIDNALEIYI